MLPPEHRAFMRSNLTNTSTICFSISIMLGVFIFKSDLFTVHIIEMMVGVLIGGSIAYNTIPIKIQPNPEFLDPILDHFDNRHIKREIIFILIGILVVLGVFFLYFLYQGKRWTASLMPQLFFYPFFSTLVTYNLCWMWLYFRMLRLKAPLSSSNEVEE